jgi:type II restriction enzyme
VGCNILLGEIPEEGKIPVIQSGNPVQPAIVRTQFARSQKLATVTASIRGWTLEVLNLLRMLRANPFSLAELYALEKALMQKHPNNKNIRPKIRQQLQVLRDAGYLRFLGRGRYEFVK